MKAKLIMILFVMSMMVGCATGPGISYSEYQEKVVMCEQMDMEIQIVNGIKNNVPYVKEVVCKDEHGATWDTSRMGD